MAVVMNLIRVTEGPTFLLRNSHYAYAIQVTDGGLIENLYYGPPLDAAPDPQPRPLRHGTVMFEGHNRLTLNELPQDYPTSGRGDFGTPALQISGADNSVLSLSYKCHTITTEKPACVGLPSSQSEGSKTLILTLCDPVQDLEIDLFYTIWDGFGVLARRVEVRNVGAERVTLRQVASTSLDLPPGQYDVQHFHGSWAREFNEERVTLPTGRFTIDSRRGTSSNAHSPYLAILEPDVTEEWGRCYGTTLLYSGNYSISVERGEFGRVRCVAGLNGSDFDWILKPGETFTTPEALHAVSQDGLGGLSHVWHDFIRSYIMPAQFRCKPRPTYLNTWEAAYFDVTQDKVLDMADMAAKLGVEMLVLDDGWFKGRTDDRRALGDWTADPDRFPSGISRLAKQVRDKGLKFGLWFEPEMVSPDSDLYRAHPDWVIGVPARTPSLGRNQLTLDLSKLEVVDHIYSQLDAHLSSGQIDYVKWDMNRNMTEVSSAAQVHRYMLGLYDLLARLTEAYPDVLFENCASGGNRFDLGMLSYMPQGWISDMCDPVGRLSIINGASHLFPMDVMAAYIGPSPNHQNGRVSSLKSRYLAGLPCAAHGLSLSLSDINASQGRLQDYVAQSKASATERLNAHFHRLRHDANATIWQMVSADGKTVRVVAFQILNAPNLPTRRVRLRGLDPSARYRLEDGDIFSGNDLLHAGLPLDQPTEDFASELLILRKVS